MRYLTNKKIFLYHFCFTSFQENQEYCNLNLKNPFQKFLYSREPDEMLWTQKIIPIMEYEELGTYFSVQFSNRIGISILIAP